MLELLAFGSIWFWVFFSAIFIIMLYYVEEMNGVGATLTATITIILLYFLGNRGHISSASKAIADNPGTTFLCLSGYFVAGTVWGILKWYLFLIGKRDEAIEAVKNKAYRSGVPFAKAEEAYGSKILPPKASEHKSAIIVWMVYWPFSVPWTIINDPIKRIFRYIFNRISDFLEKMSKWVFRPVETLFEEQEAEKKAKQAKTQEERLQC